MTADGLAEGFDISIIVGHRIASFAFAFFQPRPEMH
jgi:hypothetical protein